MSKKSEKSLKSANQPKLITFAVVNLLVIGMGLFGHQTMLALFQDGVKGDWALLIRLLGLPAVGTLALGLLSWLVPREWKQVLVFWRTGPRRMPSSEAFTRIAPADHRTDMDQLVARLGPLPTEASKQNTLWYSIYRKHSTEAPVNDANSAYLLYRDMTALMPLLLLVAVLTGVLLSASLRRAALVPGGLCLEYLILIAATRNAGSRLVGNVLAIEAARQSGLSDRLSPSAGVTEQPRTRKKKSAST